MKISQWGVLLCEVKGFKVYFHHDDFILKSKKRTICIFKNNPDYQTVINYVNLKYYNKDTQEQYKQQFFKLLEG
jgi:hypothetical protein